MAKKKDEEKKALSRREFLKDTGMVVGGAALTMGALSLAGCAPEAETTTVTAPGTTVTTTKTEAATPWLPSKWDYEADVVVVGYGGVGSCAAIAAHDAGASVIVLEKDSLPRGGNTGTCGGLAYVPFSSVEAAIDYLRAQCWGTVHDEELLRATVLALQNLHEWLESLGAKLIYGKSYAKFPTLPGSECMENKWSIDVDGKAGEGKDMFAFLKSCVDARGIQVMFETPGKALIQDPVTQEILGVKALTGGTALGNVRWSREFPSHYRGGKEIYIKARKGVVLACGGFEMNSDMANWFLRDVSHSLINPTMGTPYNTGDGIYMAARAGARLWNMNNSETISTCAKVASELYGGGIGVNGNGRDIWVNRYGKRFMNEYIYWTHTKETLPIFHFTMKKGPDPDLPIASGPDDRDLVDYENVPYYMIFDETARKEVTLGPKEPGVYRDYVWSKDNSAEIEKGWIIKGDTIQELGEKIVCKDFFGRVVGMDAAGLVETVNKYNSYCAAGEDLDFGRTVYRYQMSALIPIETPPFYAMELCLGNINTQGGPVHNKNAQTIDVDGNPIPRLYSGGELSTVYGFLYQGAQNFPEALAFGRIAGENAAALAPWE